MLAKDNHVSHWKCAYPLLPVASPSQVVLGCAVFWLGKLVLGWAYQLPSTYYGLLAYRHA